MSTPDIQENNNIEESKKLDLRAIYEEYKSKWWWFVVSIIFCMGLSVAYGIYRKPIYMVNANVLISQDDQDAGSSMSRLMSGLGDFMGESSSVDDELAIMSSYSVLKQTVDTLNLQDWYFVREDLIHRSEIYGTNPPVKVEFAPAIRDTISSSISFKMKVNSKGLISIDMRNFANNTLMKVKDKQLPLLLKTPYGEFTFTKTENFINDESFKEVFSLSSLPEATENLAKKVNIGLASKKANVIGLSIEDKLPNRGQDILNTIIARYNDFGVNVKKNKGIKTEEFINHRLDTIALELDQSDKAIEHYKKDNNITDLSAEVAYQMQQKGNYENRIVNASTHLEILQLAANFITKPENRYELIPSVTGASESADNAVQAYNELVLERMKLMNNAKNNNTALKAINAQLDAMRDNIAITLDKAVQNTRVSLNDMRRKEGEALSKLGSVPTKERLFVDIKRQHSIKEQLYLFLLQQREETAMKMQGAMPRGIIIDEAFVQVKPINAGLKKLLAIGFIIGLMLPVGLLYLLNMLRTKFSTVDEVEKRTTVPVLGEVSVAHREYPHSIVVKGRHSIAELFRLIRSNLQFMLPSKTDKVVLVTSTKSGEGKSFISINVAASFALLGKKTLLIGTDIRKPQLAAYLGISRSPGLTDYLSSDSYTLSDIIQKAPLVDNLNVIVAGPIPPNPTELLESHKIDEMIETLRQQYDYIIIDSAPVGMVSDTFSLCHVADATIYVTRIGLTTFKDIDFINQLNKSHRLKHPAIVVNGTNIKKGYGYGYGQNDE